MKNLLAVLVIFSLLAFSGCVQSEEQQAIQLADNTSEVQLVTLLVNSFNNIDKCTPEKMVSILSVDGVTVPELTEEQKADFQQAIDAVKLCKPVLSKTAVKDEGSNYIVSYKLSMSKTCGGAMFDEEEPFEVNVDLSSGTATPVVEGLGSAELQEAQEVMSQLGDCTALVFWGGMSGFA